VKQGGYWSDESLKVRSVLNIPYPFRSRLKSRTTCMHNVSFLLSISYSLWPFERWWIDPSDCIPSPIPCLSALTFSICPMHPRSSVSERTALLQDGRHWNGRGRDENGLTLSWLIGPIVTSHFLWWSNRQLPILLLPHLPVFLSANGSPLGRPIDRPPREMTKPFS